MQRDHKVTLVHRVLPVRLVRRDRKATLAHPVQLVQLAVKVCKDQRAILALLALPVRKAHKGQLVHRDHRVTQDHKDQQVQVLH